MAVDYKDYYKILGVSKDADEKALRQAYRKLARKYHPDVNPGGTETFKEINEANEVLSDPEKRKKYDEMSTYYQQYGRWPGAEGAASQTGRASGFQGANYQYSTVNQDDLEDLFGANSPFSDFFETYFHSGFSPETERRGPQAQGARQRTARGEDIEADTSITLVEAYQGTTRTLELAGPAGNPRRLDVKIPAGVDEGARVRIAGQGMPGATSNGDIYLHIHIIPDARFTREGHTLRTSVDVPLTVAMLGGEARVTTPDERHLLLRIPAGTSNGRSFRLRQQGIPHTGHLEQRGDLYATANVVLPAHLTHEQKQLFEAFARSLDATDGTNQSASTGGSHA